MSESMRMIFDGPEHFKTSVVEYVRFDSYQLRQMFAYLREKEALYQDDVKRYKGHPMEHLLKAKLHEVEAWLIWMAHNLVRASKPREVSPRQLDLLI